MKISIRLFFCFMVCLATWLVAACGGSSSGEDFSPALPDIAGAWATADVVAFEGFSFARGADALYDFDDDGSIDWVLMQGSATPDVKATYGFFDGSQWTMLDDYPMGFGARDFSMSVFGDILYVIGGRRPDHPTLGVTTYFSGYFFYDATQDTPEWDSESAPFGARHSACSAVLDDQLWVIGGNHELDNLEDAWAFDGENWVSHDLVLDFSDFHEGSFFGQIPLCFVFDDALWLADYETVFRSEDGVNWTLVDDESYISSYAFGAFAFDDKLWKVGGLFPLNSLDATSNRMAFSLDGIRWKEISPVFPLKFMDVGFTLNYFATIGGDLWVILENGEMYFFELEDS